MTERKAEPKAPAPTALGANGGAKPVPPRRRGRWRRRLWRLALVGLVLAVVMRVLLPVAVPWVANRVAAGFGLSCTIENVDFALLSGEVRVYGLRVAPARNEGEPAADPYVDLEFADADLDVAALLGLALRITRLEVDGADLFLERTADGRWPLLDHFPPTASAVGESEPDPPDAGDAAETRAVDLTLPLRIDSLRAQHVRVRCRDAAVRPAIDTWVECSVRVSDLGDVERPARLAIHAHAQHLLDSATLEASWRSGGRSAEASFVCDVRGVRPKATQGWLQELGLRPIAERIALRGSGRLDVTPHPTDALAVAATLDCEPWSVLVDGSEHVRVEDVRLDAPRIRMDGGHVTVVAIDGVHATLSRSAEGLLAALGIEVAAASNSVASVPPAPGPLARTAPPQRAPPPASNHSAPATRDAADPAALAPIGWRVDELRLSDATLVLRDAANPAGLEVTLESATVRELVLGNGSDAEPVRVAATVRSPGVVGSARVTGEAWLLAEPRRAHLRLEASQLTGERLDHHLSAIGLATDLEDARASGSMELELGTANDGIQLRASLDGLQFVDGERTVAALERVDIGPVHVEPGRTRIDRVDVRGGRLPLRRDAEGVLHVLGVRTLAPSTSGTSPRGQAQTVEAAAREAAMVRDAPAGKDAAATRDASPSEVGARDAAAQPAARAATTEPASAAPAAPMPRFELGTLRWSDVVLSWHDDAVAGGVALEPITLDGELTDVGVGGPAVAAATDSGAAAVANDDVATLRARLRPAGLAEELVAEGTITTRPGPLDVRLALDVHGRALSWKPLQPYLAGLGIAAVLDAGEFEGSLRGGLRVAAGVTSVEGQLTNVRFAQGAEELASLAGLSIDGMQLSERGLHVTAVNVDRPSLWLSRRADGNVSLLGLAFDPALQALAKQQEPTPPVRPPTAESDQPVRLDLPQLPPIALDRIGLRGATVGIRDHRPADPHPPATLVVDATLQDLSTASGAGPTTFEATAHGDGFLDTARLSGRVQLLADAVEGEGTFAADGLRAGPLAGWLPNGISLAIDDGRAGAAARARVARAADGGLSVALELEHVELRDAADVLAGIERVRVQAPRIDPAAGVFTIDEVRVGGVELAVARTGPAAFQIAGIGLDTAANAAPANGTPAGDAPTADIAPPPPLPPPPPASTPPSAPDAALAPPDRAGAALPTIVLGALDLELRRLRYVDQSGPSPGQELLLDARLATAERVVLLDPDPQALPPITLALDAAIAPLVANVHADLSLAPWRDDAELKAALAVTGIDGSALRDVAPEFGEWLRGSELAGGTFGAKLALTGNTRRKSPLDVDLGRGFSAELDVEDVALRGRPDGPVLLGVDAVRIDARRIHPRAGMHFASIEVEQPHLRLSRDGQGLHVAGLVLAEPSAQPSDGTTPAAPPTTPQAATDAPAASLGPDIRVDQLLVQGIDLEVADRLVEPHLLLPLAGLDVEVAQFSTHGLAAGQPLQFTAVVQGGAVGLPKQHRATSLLGGLAASTGRLLAGGGDQVETERRPVFGEIATHGMLSFHPQLAGRVRTSVEGFELTSVRGIAKAAGIDIGDGTLDAGVELRFADEGVRTRASFTFGNLVVAEPPGGPISSYLKLPAPLQTVLFVMKDAADEITLPLDVAVPAGGISTGAIAGAAATAISTVVATAIMESPLRMVGGVGGVFGLGGGGGLLGLGSDEPPGADAQRVEFDPAEASLAPAARAAIAAIVDRVGGDQELVVELRHTFGDADFEHADLLANPDPEQARALVTRLRHRRDEIVRRRAVRTAEARVAYAVGDQDGIAACRRDLQAMAHDLGATEDALDRLLEFTRAGADRRRDRRTRATAIGIAQHRLESVRLALVEIGGAELASRIEVRRPSLARSEEVERGLVVLTPKRRKLH